MQQWLLNLAIDFPVPLRLLPSYLNGQGKNAGPLNVRPLQGFTLTYGLRCLLKLRDAGLVRITRTGQGIEQNAFRAFEGEASLNPNLIQELSFELTAEDGAAWELAAEPCWFDMENGSAEPHYERGELVSWAWTRYSQNRDLLMSVLGWFSLVEDDGEIDLSTINWTTHGDYEVLYWKHLPNVYVATFESRNDMKRWSAWDRAREPRWFADWWISKSAWYRQPWEMDGWPPQSVG